MKTVFIVMKNADMNEGRGPNIIDSVWFFRERASEYIDIQPGVQGRRCKWSEEKFGDWYIVEHTVR